MSAPRPAPDSKAVRAVQWGVLCFATVFICTVISWVSHLIATAQHLRDTPSLVIKPQCQGSSIGISIVAIPVFLSLLSIVHFTFWGLLKDKDRL